MQIQKIFYGNFHNPQLRGQNVINAYCENPVEQPVDKFTLSFGLKPLTIPKGMFKTAEEVNAFSKAVEAIRTITEHNFNKKAYRVITKQFFDGDETTDLYNSAIVFIKRNDPKIKLKTEYEFDNWESRKFWLCFNSKEGKKIVESDYDFDDIDDLIAFDSLGLIQ